MNITRIIVIKMSSLDPIGSSGFGPINIVNILLILLNIDIPLAAAS